MIEIMQSIKPKWCELIISGGKTIEVRKSRPKCGIPFKVYIYCTKPTFPHKDYIIEKDGACIKKAFYEGGKVIGEYVCRDLWDYPWVTTFCSKPYYNMADCYLREAMLSKDELYNYGNKRKLYAYHISHLKIYDKPLELRNFRHPCPYTDKPCSLCEYADYSSGELECRTGIDRAPQDWCYIRRIE